MNTKKLQAAIEAILFTMGESVELSKIAAAIEQDEPTTRGIISDMMTAYEKQNRGIRIIELDHSFQLCTKKEYYDYLIRIARQPKRYVLTDVMLETLSIIAYRQPVTKLEIEKIRGVKSDHAVNKLVEYGLVEEVGRMDAPGRPILFGTTEEFLRRFSVQSLDDLPSLAPEQIEHLYNSLNEIRQELITPVYTPAEDTLNLWNNVQYNSLDIPDDTPDFYSDNGEQVRSKSELIIANKLKQHNIPYKYEYPLVLSTGVTVHPDFTCLNINTRQEFIWEHFGIMGDSDYMNKTLKKINDYAKSGYVLGRNFIATFESSSIPLLSLIHI